MVGNHGMANAGQTTAPTRNASVRLRRAIATHRHRKPPMHKTASENFYAIRKSSLEEQVRFLLDYAEITDVVTRYGQCVDMHDFDMLRSCYTDEIEMDHRPTTDMDRTRFTADEWCRLAQLFHTQLDGDEHILVPQSVVVNGDCASCHVLMHANHFKRDAKGGPYQSLIGSYDLGFQRTGDGWKICRSVQSVRWSEGNWQFHSDIARSLGG
jgi:ketosteroid isomerase-like protein